MAHDATLTKSGRNLQKSKKARATRVGGAMNEKLHTLYERPLKAARTGVLFSAFPYPTKISPETIALFIAAHTKPGETVFDGFAGSGTTGIAALLCSNPTEEMKKEAKRLGLKVTWGARRAVLNELRDKGFEPIQTVHSRQPRGYRIAPL